MSAPSREEAVRAARQVLEDADRIEKDISEPLHRHVEGQLEALGRALLAERERAASEYARGLAEGRELLMAVALEAWGYGCGTSEDASRFANMSRAEVDKEQRDDCAGIVERALSGAAKGDDDGR